MKLHLLTLAALSLFLFALHCGQTFGQVQPKPAIPIEPVKAIIDALKSHSVVTLGEGAHGNVQSHEFRLALLRDPRFAAAVNDIVVEFGNGLYQDVIDRFIRGETVPYDQVRQVWQNTIVGGTLWDFPIYEEFYRAVRDLNAKLPKGRQLRVLLGDLPVDWNTIHSWSDFSKYTRDNAFPVDIIQREVIAKHRHALVIFGDGHFWRRNTFYPLKDMALAESRYARPNQSIVTRLERAGTPVFSIGTVSMLDLTTVQPDIANWTLPTLALLRDTTLGVASSIDYYGSGGIYVTVDKENGTEELTSPDRARAPLMQEQFDAVMYFGPPSALTRAALSPKLCADAEYMKMRLKRLEIIAPPGEGDLAAGLKSFCAKVAGK